MPASFRGALLGLPLLLLLGCSSSLDVQGTPPPNSGDPASTTSLTTPVFDPAKGQIPLPNILATATAGDPLASRPANKPMTPPEALAYVARYEMGGPAQGLPVGRSTNAVSGLNAPIYIRFTAPVVASTVTAANVKVFQLGIDANGVTENGALGFTDISGLFTYKYKAGGTDLFLFPNFPLSPGTRYAYFVTNRVLDAATNKTIIAAPVFGALKSTTSLAGTLFAALEPIRADVTSGPAILLSGYAKTMDDAITASATTTISSRANITLMARFITTGAGYIRLDETSGAPGTSLIPVESALRAFAAGANLGQLPGKTWNNSVTLQAVFTKGNAIPQLDTSAYWFAATNSLAVPPSIGTIAIGVIHSADLSMDPAVVRDPANIGTINLTGVTLGGFPAYNPAAGVVQPFRANNPPNSNLIGYYHTDRLVPFLYIAPATAAPSGGYPLVIFQHGITSQKEAALAMSQACTSTGRAILAIDLPLHGQLAVPGHTAGAQWGQDFMAVGAPLATRNNVQQAAFNLDRLEFTLRTGGFSIALGGAGVPGSAPAFTGNPTYVGQSLGSIVGAYYLAGNTVFRTPTLGDPRPYNDATLDASMKGFLSVPGARTAYLIQNSPAFGPTVDAGLAAVGIVKNSVTYHQFFLVTQTIVDPIDPATMTTPLAAGLSSRLSRRIAIQEATSSTFDPVTGAPTNGDLVITNPYTRYFGNALGGRGVLGALGAVVGPNFSQLAYTAGGTPAHAAGVVGVPFMYYLNPGPTPKVVNAAVIATATTPNEGYFQFDQAGIGHSFLLNPASPALAGLAQKQMLYFLSITGTSIVVDPTQTGPALPPIVNPAMPQYPETIEVIH